MPLAQCNFSLLPRGSELLIPRSRALSGKMKRANVNTEVMDDIFRSFISQLDVVQVLRAPFKIFFLLWWHRLPAGEVSDQLLCSDTCVRKYLHKLDSYQSHNANNTDSAGIKYQRLVHQWNFKKKLDTWKISKLCARGLKLFIILRNCQNDKGVGLGEIYTKSLR